MPPAPTRTAHLPVAVALILFAATMTSPIARASNLLDLPVDDGRDPRITGVWFISYIHEDVYSEPNHPDRPPDFSRFEIQRGYLTYQVRITDRLRARVTSDISVDQEGDGAGDMELRLKYGYVELDVGDVGPLRGGEFRAGVLQTPWLSFEQSINDFRLQGPMFLNRERVLFTADYGIGYFADLGAPVDESYRRRVNRRHSGRWGSVAAGIYNGGGYNDIEQNESFVTQARLSLRPLLDFFPGLQLSVGYGSGTGNTDRSPDYESRVAMLSVEGVRGVLTVTGYDGVGDLRGNSVDENGRSFDQWGASIFGEIRFLDDFSALGRFDFFRREDTPSDRDVERWFVGVAWRCIRGGQLLLDYENQKLLGGPVVQRNEQVMLALEFRF